MRDLAEAARRFASGGLPDDDGVDRDRRNIGRDLVENAPDGTLPSPLSGDGERGSRALAVSASVRGPYALLAKTDVAVLCRGAGRAVPSPPPRWCPRPGRRLPVRLDFRPPVDRAMTERVQTTRTVERAGTKQSEEVEHDHRDALHAGGERLAAGADGDAGEDDARRHAGGDGGGRCAHALGAAGAAGGGWRLREAGERGRGVEGAAAGGAGGAAGRAAGGLLLARGPGDAGPRGVGGRSTAGCCSATSWWGSTPGRWRGSPRPTARCTTCWSAR